MIEAFSLRNAHGFGDALPSQARLRKRIFVDRKCLEHHSFEDMEYDEFDTPGTVYFVWRDDDDQVRGLLRLLPTTIPYMIQSYWPHLIADGNPPCDRGVWEVTRLCADRTLPAHQRIRVMPELLCALQEYCALNEIQSVIGVTRPHLIELYIRQGIRWLGELQPIEGEFERAFQVPLQFIRPTQHCRKLGIQGRVLSMEPLRKRALVA